jgi:hypothetical protein
MPHKPGGYECRSMSGNFAGRKSGEQPVTGDIAPRK